MSSISQPDFPVKIDDNQDDDVENQRHINTMYMKHDKFVKSNNLNDIDLKLVAVRRRLNELEESFHDFQCFAHCLGKQMERNSIIHLIAQGILGIFLISFTIFMGYHIKGIPIKQFNQ